MPPSPSPAGPDDADVVWDTPSSNGFLGSMPLGNGKLGANIWAEPDSRVGLLLSHVDAFNENSILSKLGRVKIRVLPDQEVQQVQAGTYEEHGGLIGAQPSIKTVTCRGQVGCPTIAAAACDSTPGCTGFGLCPTYRNGTVT
jgi:hypothetical protein